MMPVVTVPARPSGEPIAMTGSPTTRSRDCPSVRRRQLLAGLHLDDGEVGLGVAPDDLGRQLDCSAPLNVTVIVAAVRRRDVDDVVVGEDVAVAAG